MYDILSSSQLKRAGELLLSVSSQRPKSEFDKFSIALAIVGMSRESLPEYERDVLQEFALREGLSFDRQRVFIPFSTFRALSKGVASAGGFLVAAETQAAVDILRPFSVTARAGISVEVGVLSVIRLYRE